MLTRTNMLVRAVLCSATVWRARCLVNNEIVAVKIMDLEAQMAPLQDIIHEAQTMKVGPAPAVLGPWWQQILTGQAETGHRHQDSMYHCSIWHCTFCCHIDG